jgi:hypothetical protein
MWRKCLHQRKLPVDVRNAYSALVEKPGQKRQLWRPRSRMEDNIVFFFYFMYWAFVRCGPSNMAS